MLANSNWPSLFNWHSGKKRYTVGSHIKRHVAFEFFLAPVVALMFGVRLPGLEPSEARFCATSSSH